MFSGAVIEFDVVQLRIITPAVGRELKLVRGVRGGNRLNEKEHDCA